MGERGPLPSPTRRRRNKRTSSGRHIDVARPEPPASLDEEARAEWERVVPDLETMGLLTRVDRGVLIRYCTMWSDWVDTNKNLKATGALVRGQRSAIVRSPLWIMRNDIEDRLAELTRQLGLSSSARIRAGVEHDQPELADEHAEEIASISEYRARLNAG